MLQDVEIEHLFTSGCPRGLFVAADSSIQHIEQFGASQQPQDGTSLRLVLLTIDGLIFVMYVANEAVVHEGCRRYCRDSFSESVREGRRYRRAVGPVPGRSHRANTPNAARGDRWTRNSVARIVVDEAHTAPARSLHELSFDEICSLWRRWRTPPSFAFATDLSFHLEEPARQSRMIPYRSAQNTIVITTDIEPRFSPTRANPWHPHVWHITYLPVDGKIPLGLGPGASAG